jgi:tricarballylate dehydrogenase
MLGGGTAMMNGEYATAFRLGVQVAYEAAAEDLTFDDARCTAVSIRFDGALHTVRAGAVVAACGGFEANLEWLREYWGAAADNFVIRGTPYNQGRMLRVLLDNHAQAIGNPREFHAVAVDARAPKFDGGIVTRLDSTPFGIAVNRDGQRFYDEGEDFWPKRYAIWGGLIARQTDQIAYSIVDAKVLECFMPSVFPPVTAGTVREIAEHFELDAATLEATVAGYNRAVRPGIFDPGSLDNCYTEGLHPDKSHWALPLDTPPYHAYPLRPGITFTYHGVEVNEYAQVVRDDGRLFDNVFAAGEMMAGNILGRGYLAGFGLTIGTVFGRIAGKEAAKRARG